VKTKTIKYILNKQEIGNIWNALKTIIDENLSAGPKDEGILLMIMPELATIYDGLNHGDVEAVEMDPDTAHYVWQALSYVLEHSLVPESQYQKLLTTVQHMGESLELINNIELDPKDVIELENEVGNVTPIGEHSGS